MSPRLSCTERRSGGAKGNDNEDARGRNGDHVRPAVFHMHSIIKTRRVGSRFISIACFLAVFQRIQTRRGYRVEAGTREELRS